MFKLHNQHFSKPRSINHIQKLHEEARFLKTHLEKMESKAYFDLDALENSSKAKGSSFFRRLLLISSILFLGGFVYQKLDPTDYALKTELIKEKLYLTLPYFQQVLQLITINGKLKSTYPITLVSE